MDLAQVGAFFLPLFGYPVAFCKDNMLHVFFSLCKIIKRLNVPVICEYQPNTNPAQLEVTENHLGADKDLIFLFEQHFKVLFIFGGFFVVL